MNIILVALAVASISMTLTQSSLFRIIQKCKLLQCPYCAAHWISLLLWISYTFIYPKTIDLFFVLINVFATVTISVLPMLAIAYLNTRMDRHASILHSPHRAL